MRRYRPLLIALGAQILVLVLVPARVLVARTIGADVTLRTEPVDPYDLLSGYYVTLSYEVEGPENPVTTPEWEIEAPMYVIVARDAPAWRFVRFSADRDPKGDDELALRARWGGGRARLENAGRYYIPEARRGEIEGAMARTARRALVDVRVGPDGTLALLRLRADGQTFAPIEME